MKDKIEARLAKLEADTGMAVQKLAQLRAEAAETESLIHRMQGAAQVCREFLQPAPIDQPPPAEPPPGYVNGEQRAPVEDAMENGR